MKSDKTVRETLFSAGILVSSFLLCLITERYVDIAPLIPLVFNLAVFLISRYTSSYAYGIFASLISVLAVNYAFTFPVFRLNFTIFENFVSAVILLTVTIMTCTMTMQIKMQEKKRREMELEKMRANLLRAITHDLRTPLTTIYGGSQTLLDCDKNDCLSSDAKTKIITAMRDDAKWLIDLVENLLSITKIEDGRLNFSKRSTPLEELTDAVLIKFRAVYPFQRVDVSLPFAFVAVPMDPLLIEQVLLNLLENAMQHAKGMTTLIFRVTTDEKNAYFEIADDGCGVPKERIAVLFHTMATRAERETDETALPIDGGTRSLGIGLYVCAAIIKAHGGSISAKNREPKGFSVQFCLPIKEDHND